VEAAEGGPYVMRIHRATGVDGHPRRTAAEIRSEMEWLAALRRDTDLVVPEPVRTRDGALLTTVEVDGVPDPRLCVLFHWVDGRFVNRGLTPKHLWRVGVLVARLHEHVTSQFVPAEGFTRSVMDDLSTEMVDSYTSMLAEVCPREDVELVEAAIGQMRRVQDALGSGSDAFGLIHADLHQWNYLFHRGEVHAIDFDDCGWGHFVYDIAVALSELEHKPHYPQLRAALLEGYRSVRPLSAEHESLLSTFIAFRTMVLMLWFIEERNHPAFTRWQEEVDYGLKTLRAFIGTPEPTTLAQAAQ